MLKNAACLPFSIYCTCSLNLPVSQPSSALMPTPGGRNLENSYLPYFLNYWLYSKIHFFILWNVGVYLSELSFEKAIIVANYLNEGGIRGESLQMKK